MLKVIDNTNGDEIVTKCGRYGQPKRAEHLLAQLYLGRAGRPEVIISADNRDLSLSPAKARELRDALNEILKEVP